MKTALLIISVLFCSTVFAQRILHVVDNLQNLVKIKPSSVQPDMMVLQVNNGLTNEFRVYKWTSGSTTSTNDVDVIAYPYGSATGRWIYQPNCGCAWTAPCFEPLTSVQFVAKSISETSWSNNLAIPKHNSATYGDLRSVKITLVGSVRSTPSIENLDSNPRTLVVGTKSTCLIKTAGQIEMAVSPQKTISQAVTAFDGVIDFGGPGGGPGSGFSSPPISGTATNSISVFQGHDWLDEFVGSGNLLFTNTATSEAIATGSPSTYYIITHEAGDTLTVTYSYCGIVSLVSDIVWNDANLNGSLDVGEQGIPGVNVYLKDSNGFTIGSTVTNASGRYVLSRAIPFEVGFELLFVDIDIPPAYGQIYDLDDGVTNMPSSPGSAAFILNYNENKTDVDFGLYLL